MTLFALALMIVGGAAIVWKALTSTGESIHFTHLKLSLVALLAFGLQLAALRWAEGIERIGLYSLSQVLLLTFFSVNFNCKSLRPLAIGFLLNFVPIVLNHGYMPITQTAMVELHPVTRAADWPIGLVRPGSKDIVVSPTETSSWILGDVFVIGKPFPLPTAFSLGDLLILLGFGWAVYYFTPLLGVRHVTTHRFGTHDERRCRRQSL